MHLEKKCGLFAFFFLLSAFCCIFSACGKKGEPTLKSYEKPPPPSSLSAVHRESEILFTWSFPKGKESFIKGFHLLKSSGEEFQEIAFLDKNIRSYADTVFSAGDEYRYKMISQNLKGIFSNESNVLVIKPLTTPAPPENLFLKVGHDSLTLTWKSAGNGMLYNVYKSEKSGAYPLSPLTKEPLKETFFEDGINIGKTFYYTVRSLPGGEFRHEGASSIEIKVDPVEFLPSSPRNLQAVPGEQSVHLIWKEAPEEWVSVYRIYRETDEEGFKLIGETQTPSFVDKEKASTKRNYRVSSLGPLKEGPAAEIKGVVYIDPK
jgi:hypothetical protein